jgi:hypothetical protein
MKKFFQKQIEKAQKRDGFTLLFAILVAILVLAVGTSIVNLSLKQIALSSTARDSQFAFYAANSGVDCALYWDTAGQLGLEDKVVFATSSESEVVATGSGISCADQDITNETGVEVLGADIGWSVVHRDSNSAVTSFWLDFGTDLPYCANVIVTKEESGGDITTTIQSYGYNTCENNPRRIERGLELIFES